MRSFTPRTFREIDPIRSELFGDISPEESFFLPSRMSSSSSYYTSLGAVPEVILICFFCFLAYVVLVCNAILRPKPSLAPGLSQSVDFSPLLYVRREPENENTAFCESTSMETVLELCQNHFGKVFLLSGSCTFQQTQDSRKVDLCRYTYADFSPQQAFVISNCSEDCFYIVELYQKEDDDKEE